jgi:glycosyltransferase involved in cell wall biosynthesis
MRVLILCYEFPPLGGGGSKVVQGLSDQLASMGHEVHIVTTRFGDSPSYEERDNLAIWRVGSLRRRLDRSNMLELGSYVVAALFRATLLLKRNRYDICHAHFIFPDGVVAWLLRLFAKQNFVITAHGSDVPGYNPHRFVWAHRLLSPLWHRVSQAADCIVCPSEFLEGLLNRHSPESTTAVIPNGFDPERFSKPAERKKRILCVTRLFERKGVQYLIEAVRDQELPYELHIVGDGPYREELEALAENSRTPIQFHGWVDNNAPEMEQLFTGSEIFVLASEAENFPVSLLEAMSAGLAIVTCSDTGSADVVGDTALLVPSKDAGALRQALLRLTGDNDLRVALAKKARKRLEDNFSWISVAGRHLRLYRKYAMQPQLSAPEVAGTGLGDTRELPNFIQQSGPQRRFYPANQSQPAGEQDYVHIEKLAK